MPKLNLKRKVIYLYYKLVRTRGSVTEIALGAGIGAFISVFPTFGFGTLLVLLMYRFMKFNLISALAMSVISNPFTSPLFMLMSFQLGRVILNKQVNFNLDNWEQNLSDTSICILLGSTIISSTIALIAYYTMKTIVIRYRQNSNRNLD